MLFNANPWLPFFAIFLSANLGLLLHEDVPVMQNYVFTFFSKAFRMETQPLKIAAEIIFMRSQINLKTWNVRKSSLKTRKKCN